MSEKRKDNKGRVLRNGESQRSDGMYMYRFSDAGGVRRTIYSWRLVETDKIPTGKRTCDPLREMERQLERDTEDGIQSFVASKITLNEMFAKHMSLKKGIKQTTKNNYYNLYNSYLKDEFGERYISSIKYSDVKRHYLHLYFDRGLKPRTIIDVDKTLRPIFNLAVRDGYIRLNPANDVIKEIKKENNWEQEKRHALTITQQNNFIDYVANSPKHSYWLNLFTVFLGTGGRAGEILGLRWEDCDFKRNMISINHNLLYIAKNGKHQFIITTPKTEAGKREIPMLKDVRKALLNEKEKQLRTGFNRLEVDGYSGFIFKNKHDNLVTHSILNNAIKSIIHDYNQDELERAKKERRKPQLLPHFSLHNLRHTFCTRFCEHETDLKIIQEVMGHAKISTTMDVYNEVTQERKETSLANLEGKIKIS